jgi:UDP-N-acetyl-D-galactosamine dehydrogenase
LWAGISVRGAIVVFESTVFPRGNEDICIPILEKESGLRCGQDFKIGYSRKESILVIKFNRLENITKIVSGMDEATLEVLRQFMS